VIRSTVRLFAFLLLLTLASGNPVLAQSGRSDVLAPTAHPPLPKSPSELWLVPTDKDVSQRVLAPLGPLTEGAAKFAAGDYAGAFPLVSQPSLGATALRDYASYYSALSLLRLSKSAEARKRFHDLRENRLEGYLAVGSAIGEAEAAEALGDYKSASAIYKTLAEAKATVNEDVLSRLARSALAAGDRKTAAEAYVRVYYEYSLSDAAIAAETQLETLKDQLVRSGYKADLGRAQILYGARRYSEARAAFAALQSQVSGDDRELVDLRAAECDFFMKRYPAARDGMQPYLESASRKAEARFFYLSALRELGQSDAYVAATQQLVTDFPDSSWSEEALNNLGTYYILANDDERAAQAFRTLYEKFPQGSRAERAAWKYGWWQYKTGQYTDTVRVFEGAAALFSRSDYRPSFLYWAARAHGKLGNGAQAEERLQLVRADYGSSYYGRLAASRLARRSAALATDIVSVAHQTTTATPIAIPTEPLIRVLLAAGLYDDALNELRFAQRAWGSSTALDATIAWVYHRKGELRRAITLMRRAYPQHLTASGQDFPNEILQVIYPLTYWDLIRKHSQARGLDPYIVAALIGQESTFDAGVRSAANAWGLMQVVPATGRRLAQTLGIRRFTTTMLTDAETNIRLGTLYFSRLIQQFGGVYYALASYNAGENRVVRWKAERPGVDQDEFIDDIPFPETQNYVKRILGTAEDYRRLYGTSGGQPIPVARITSSGSPAAAVSSSASSKTTAMRKPASKKPTTKGNARRSAPKKRAD
jgi:soluble lytic murein transglycosylase